MCDEVRLLLDGAEDTDEVITVEVLVVAIVDELFELLDVVSELTIVVVWDELTTVAVGKLELTLEVTEETLSYVDHE